MAEDIDFERNEHQLMGFIDGTSIQSKDALAITKRIKSVQQLWLLAKMAKDARHAKLKK